MYSEQITIARAVITAIHLKVEDSKIQTRIIASGAMSPELAQQIGARSLIYAENGTPKGGYTAAKLDTGCAAFRAVFEADPALKQSFELLSGDSTDSYVVTREADGALKLKFRLNYHGDPHQAIAFVQMVGNAECSLKITPLQTEIPANAKDEDDEDEEEQNDLFIDDADPVIASQDAVRQRLINHTSKRAQ
jgi:hypothetical protein